MMLIFKDIEKHAVYSSGCYVLRPALAKFFSCDPENPLSAKIITLMIISAVNIIV